MHLHLRDWREWVVKVFHRPELMLIERLLELPFMRSKVSMRGNRFISGEVVATRLRR